MTQGRYFLEIGIGIGTGLDWIGIGTWDLYTAPCICIKSSRDDNGCMTAWHQGVEVHVIEM